MKTENYITSSCIIAGNQVFKDGQLYFEAAGLPLSDFLTAVYRHLELSYPKFHKMDNLSKLGLLANEVLLQPGFNREKYRPEEVGILLSNASSSLDTDIKYFETAKTIASPAQFVYTLPNIVIGEIAIRHGFKGENGFFIFEAFDAGFLEHYAGNLLENNIMQCCICGWVEVLEENYKASLFLIEKEKSANSVIFTAENCNRLFQLK